MYGTVCLDPHPFPPTWLFHGISIKLGAHRPHMWGSSKHTSTFSHLSSGMCASTSDCCGCDHVQARHWEEGYIACLVVTYGTVEYLWSFEFCWYISQIFKKKYTEVKSGLCANYLPAPSEQPFCGDLLWLPLQHLQTVQEKKKKKQTPVSRSRQLIHILSKWSK